ncbi:hypothetical protein IMZ16_08180 [Cruoricaptor ignavus]|uniref:WG containing repeat-containing protein n=1 Tax=Cruoricaptor ignavus TaxID=1118202 RepID=A0A7M1T128_9FLAO|nr:hypothetical protein [Cruoricaptor ignavus]QOR73495.1 hypothetical protein IMZ16_08180 [Cruoricaptor ignavus]
MKKAIVILTLGIFGWSSAQVAFGKDEISHPSASLEFGNGAKGLILPYANSVSALADTEAGQQVVPGTLIYDASDNIIRYCKEGDCADKAQWLDLSKNVQNVKYRDVAIADTTGKVDLSIQNGKTDNKSARVVIGSNEDAEEASGILVLSDTDKVMILPKMESPHLNIINPEPGTIAYDTKANQVAVFNGTVWSFWR